MTDYYFHINKNKIHNEEDNYCIICNVSMGIHNPRQLCGKGHCENDLEIY